MRLITKQKIYNYWFLNSGSHKTKIKFPNKQQEKILKFCLKEKIKNSVQVKLLFKTSAEFHRNKRYKFKENIFKIWNKTVKQYL